MLPVGIGPGVIENEFTIGIVLFIERHGRYQFTFLVDRNVPGQPTELPTYTAVMLHRGKKSMVEKRLSVSHQTVPLVLGNLVDLIVNLYLQINRSLMRLSSGSSFSKHCMSSL